MGNIHHANAKTTVRIQEEIQKSEESIARRPLHKSGDLGYIW